MNKNKIELRSDTFTLPTKEMKEAMFSAEVGDDVFGEDPTVNALETYCADLFGMETALFCSSGTQTNQIAIKMHTKPGDEVICHELAHIYLYEGGGIAYNSGASVKLISGDYGRFTTKQAINCINKEDIHFPTSSLISVENTVNRGGGACWDFEEIKEISELSKAKGLKFHLDGARLFNALVAKKETPKQYGAVFDSISICLSKGLGAPVGSVLIGSKADIKLAKRIRKVMGGGMRQAGFLAAAGLYALEHNIKRLADDHQNAKFIEQTLKEQTWVKETFPVETNIVIFKMVEEVPFERFLNYLNENEIKASGIGNNSIRFVFHLGQDEGQIITLRDYIINFIA